MAFAQRLSAAVAHERAVATHLRSAGWTVCSFGQGQLSPEVREILRRKATLLRWIPDLLVVHRDEDPFLADAKVGRTDTKFWSIEKRSHVAHKRCQDAFEMPVYCVWTDMSWSTTDDISEGIANGAIRSGAFHGVGSETPFYLVPKEITEAAETLKPRRTRMDLRTGEQYWE